MHLSGGVLHQSVLVREAVSGLRHFMGTDTPTANNMHTLAYSDFLVEPKE
jgi:hypothetical protein